jgi:hypothetical protein
MSRRLKGIQYTIQDNYLNETDYKNIKNVMLGGDFSWHFFDTVASFNDQRKFHFFWTHVFFVQNAGVTSPLFKILNPILKKIKFKALIRVKANLYSNQGKIEEHQKHVDYPFKHKAALFSLNTCNGFTTLNDGTKIKSVGNRMLFFDPSIPHHSSTCTDASVRANINFNYF